MAAHAPAGVDADEEESGGAEAETALALGIGAAAKFADTAPVVAVIVAIIAAPTEDTRAV
jgi:hypothetical protein